MSKKTVIVERSPLSPIQTLLCGFAGIVVPKSLLAPFDTLKLFSQIYGESAKEKIINQIKLEGFPTLFNGILCDWIRIPVQSIAHYTLFNNFRNQMNASVADTIAATAAATLFHPLDVVQSLMISNPIKYPTISGTIATILSEDGFLGLYHGIMPTIIGHIPHRSIQLAAHIYMKKISKQRTLFNEFLIGGSTMVFSRFATYPFDTVRKRMMCDETMKGKSMIEVIKITHKTRGFKGFYNGFGVSFAKVLPMIYLQETLTKEFRKFMGRFNYLMEQHNFKTKRSANH